MKYIAVIILLLLIGSTSSCGDEINCEESKRFKTCTIDKLVYPDSGLEIIFNYDTDNRVVSLLSKQGKTGFNIEYSKSDKIRKVTLFSEDGFDRTYTYEHSALRTEITVDDPSDEFFTKEYITLRRNSCGHIIKSQSFRGEFRDPLNEMTLEWMDGNIKNFSIDPGMGNCSDITYEFDDNPNPFYTVSEIVLNPLFSSQNNIIRSENGCTQPGNVEIEYLSNGYPQSIKPFILSFIFMAGVNPNIFYRECP